MGNNLTATRDRELREVDDGLVGTLPPKKFHGLPQQLGGGAVGTGRIDHLVQQSESAIDRCRVVAQQSGQSGLIIEETAETE